MSYRFMRMIVFFDLPVETAAERRDYAKFRKFLIKNGFMMMQESVYCKLLLNQTAADAAAEKIRNNKPGKGLIQILLITEKQYSKIEFVLGSGSSDIINSDERFVEL
ncbi:MAG: CRISPR-associated endonuclease Cas2 [Synergistes sp.]|nr:CRISPR-associated endonuclease Cas2 [Synergistes sp.]